MTQEKAVPVVERLEKDLEREHGGNCNICLDETIVRRSDLRALLALTRADEQQAATIAELREAGEELVAKLDECEPRIANAFAMEQMRGRPYSGPQYGEALKAFRAALAKVRS